MYNIYNLICYVNVISKYIKNKLQVSWPRPPRQIQIHLPYQNEVKEHALENGPLLPPWASCCILLLSQTSAVDWYKEMWSLVSACELN